MCLSTFSMVADISNIWPDQDEMAIEDFDSVEENWDHEEENKEIEDSDENIYYSTIISHYHSLPRHASLVKPYLQIQYSVILYITVEPPRLA